MQKPAKIKNLLVSQTQAPDSPLECERQQAGKCNESKQGHSHAEVPEFYMSILNGESEHLLPNFETPFLFSPVRNYLFPNELNCQVLPQQKLRLIESKEANFCKKKNGNERNRIKSPQLKRKPIRRTIAMKQQDEKGSEAFIR
ncbi:hypothetical protein NPIL_567331 [Nephila pilipes]|uniref:Uncharacterized protein n=1 Tax=Nephila pilipes TaxID=299642 RepID=A0A8X6P2C0_NEPPI|nr:hypothetical protein NPIL_567331 [Nephila pilipes]